MTRQLLCRKCGDDYDLHRDDKREGHEMRKRYVSIHKVPPGHGIRVVTEGHSDFEPMDKVVCDGCNTVLNDIGVAVTTWRFNEEPEPRAWESEFGSVLPKEVANAAQNMEAP